MVDIDPPWRLDPTINIINLSWGDQYRLVGFLLGQKGNPQWVIQFASSKAYTQADVDSKKVPAPTFGSSITIPTATASNNQEIGNIGTSNIIAFTGNSLVNQPPDGNPDWRGYTELDTFTLEKTVFDFNGSFAWGPKFPPDGPKRYFDFNGESTTKAKIPKDPSLKRGLALASDDEGTVYVLGNDGITKYGKDGSQLWRKTPTPDACNYDSKNKQIVAVTGNEIKKYGLDGNIQGTIDVAGTIGNGDVSRKGKMYWSEPFDPDSGHWPGILGFDTKGSKIFTIPGESIDDGAQFGAITAYGEDYLVAVTTKGLGVIAEGHSDPGAFNPNFDWNTFETIQGVRVYDANNGSLISDTHWEDHITTQSFTFWPGPFEYERDDVDSYGFCRGLLRSAYFPFKK